MTPPENNGICTAYQRKLLSPEGQKTTETEGAARAVFGGGAPSRPAAATPTRMTGSLLGCGRLWLPHRRRAIGPDLGVPRAGETAAADLVAREDVVIDRPFGARHLVKHFDAVAVGIAGIDAERDPVIGDVLDR